MNDATASATKSTITAPTTTIYLVRHGEVANPDRIVYGRLDGFPLSSRGHSMAETVADHLTDPDITVIWSSPLLRTQQTAAPLAARLGLAVQLDERLTEAGNNFEGRAVRLDIASLLYPLNWPQLRNPFRPSWGEPYTAVTHRMAEALTDIIDAATGHAAVIVSHQLPICVLQRHLRGQRLWHDPRRRQCATGSVTCLRFRGAALTDREYRPLGVRM